MTDNHMQEEEGSGSVKFHRLKLTLSFQLCHTLFEAMIFNFSSGNRTDAFNKQAEPLGAASF